MATFTSEEKELLVFALQLRCNLIETGSPHLSAVDVQKITGAAFEELSADEVRKRQRSGELPRVQALGVDARILLEQHRVLIKKIQTP